MNEAANYALKNSELTHKHGCVIVFDNNIVPIRLVRKSNPVGAHSIPIYTAPQSWLSSHV